MTTEAKKRKFNTAEFKAKVGLQALGAEKTVNELRQHKVHPVQVRQWKAEIQAQAKSLFEGKRAPKWRQCPNTAHPRCCTARSGGSKSSWTGSKKSQD